VAHRREGKVFVYHARVGRRSLAARAVRQIIDRFCAGSVEQFLVGMVDERVLPLSELERLALLLRRPLPPGSLPPRPVSPTFAKSRKQP
jgi:predicted transcriptional regulator